MSAFRQPSEVNTQFPEEPKKNRTPNTENQTLPGVAGVGAQRSSQIVRTRGADEHSFTIQE
jgi:hypothetical protein